MAGGTQGWGSCAGRAPSLKGKRSRQPKNNKTALHLIHCHLASFWQSTKSDTTFFHKIPEKQHRTSVKPCPLPPGPSEGLEERFLIKWRAISPSDISAGAFKLQMFPLWKKSLYNAALLVIFMEVGRGQGVRSSKQERLQAVALIHRRWTAWGYQLCVFAQLLTWPRENKDHPSSPAETKQLFLKGQGKPHSLQARWEHSISATQQDKSHYSYSCCFKNVLQEALICNICLVTEALM